LPASNRAPSASGIDIPVIKRNAGKTRSVNVMPSTSGATWRRNAGVSVTPAISLTNSINRTSSPRRRSTDSNRRELGPALTISSAGPADGGAKIVLTSDDEWRTGSAGIVDALAGRRQLLLPSLDGGAHEGIGKRDI
jgi:hypothetical protein